MKPSKIATKRTKERFAMHSPFTEVRRDTCAALGGKACVLLTSQAEIWLRGEKWLGWIPIEEIDFD
jgi:hypothetical protein